MARKFTLSQAYLLMVDVEVEQFLHDNLISTPQIVSSRDAIPPNLNPLFPKARRVYRLGNVYFDQNKTTAVVYSAVYETPYDLRAAWKVFKKTASGNWEETRSWGGCGRAAGR